MYGRNRIALGDQRASVGNAIVESPEVGPRVRSWNRVGRERPSDQCFRGEKRTALLLSSTPWLGWPFERWALPRGNEAARKEGP